MSPGWSVSVVIPTYNRADLLGEAITSALGQTEPPAEVIVVDDGSTDATPGVVARFGGRVRYVPQARAGQSAARNLGASLAAGEFIAMLDSDDAWEPRKLECQLALHREVPDLRWSVTDCLVVDAAGTPVPGRQGFKRVFVAATEHAGPPHELFERHLARHAIRTPAGEHLAYAGDFFELLFRGNLALPSTALVRRDAWERVGGFDLSYHSATDTEFFHRLAAVAPGGVLMERLTRYRLGSSGKVSVPARSVEKIHNAIRSAEVAAQLRQPLAPSAREAFADGRRRLLRRLAWTHLANFEPAEARETIRAWRREGGTWDAGTAAWRLLAALPGPVLRRLHAAGRAARGRVGK